MLPLANIFQPLIDVFKPVLVFFHDSIGFGWGWSIVALTVCVRALLLPLAVKQYRSMKALQEIAPVLKKVQARYKHDNCGSSAADASSKVCDAVEKGSGQFLFIPDLTDKATGSVLVILIVLYV